MHVGIALCSVFWCAYWPDVVDKNPVNESCMRVHIWCLDTDIFIGLGFCFESQLIVCVSLRACVNACMCVFLFHFFCMFILCGHVLYVVTSFISFAFFIFYCFLMCCISYFAVMHLFVILCCYFTFIFCMFFLSIFMPPYQMVKRWNPCRTMSVTLPVYVYLACNFWNSQVTVFIFGIHIAWVRLLHTIMHNLINYMKLNHFLVKPISP